MPELNYSKKAMGVKNFFCILLTRPQKHALSEFQLFTATRRFSPFNHNVGLAHPCHVTLILSSGQPDPNSLPEQNRKERGWPQAHLFTSHKKNEATEELKARRRLRSFTW